MDSNSVFYLRRYSFPSTRRTIPSPKQESDPCHIQNRKTYTYSLNAQELDNERPFMTGREVIRGEEISQRPISKQIYVRKVLSDEQIENERPFMRGRVKVATEINLGNDEPNADLYNVMNNEEWENEKPFMHGRT